MRITVLHFLVLLAALVSVFGSAFVSWASSGSVFRGQRPHAEHAEGQEIPPSDAGTMHRLCTPYQSPQAFSLKNHVSTGIRSIIRAQ